MKQTALHEKHLELKAKMTDFQGWQVPQLYGDVHDEYYAVRTAAGLFDLSFLGRIEITGPGAGTLLQTLFTRNIDKMAERSAHYGLFCNENGFIMDDALLFRLSGSPRSARFLVTTNPVNTEKILAWLRKHASSGVHIEDRTLSEAQLALQGPQSAAILEKLAGPNYKKFKPRSVREMSLSDVEVLISRTGYTGEHGYEFFMPSGQAGSVWDMIMHAGSGAGIRPCGLASRDILRIEMGYVLYGNEIDETSTPLEASLSRFVCFSKEFIGKENLLKLKQEGIKRKLSGFLMIDKNIPKSEASIFSENREIGNVTSGAVSPSLRKGIGLGYVVTRYSQPGQEIEIEIRDRETVANIVDLPFYRRK